MITITTIAGSWYRVEYRLQGTLVALSEAGLKMSLKEIEKHMIHAQAMATGKIVPVPSPERKG